MTKSEKLEEARRLIEEADKMPIEEVWVLHFPSHMKPDFAFNNPIDAEKMAQGFPTTKHHISHYKLVS
jgi:hypothetical protein